MLQGLPSTVPRMAFADESFQEDSAEGAYVLAATALEPQAQDDAREFMRRLLGSRRTDKLHWYEMDRLQRKDAAHRVADIDCLHVVVVGSPVPRRRQERARAVCLATLVGALHNLGVQHLLIESRSAELNCRDVATVLGARFTLPKGSRFRVDHVRGSDEPLLWVADVVAGAVRASLRDSSAEVELLGERVRVLKVPTGC
jgi:hypothetical protein